LIIKYTPPLPAGGEEGAFIFISPHPDLLPAQGEGTFMCSILIILGDKFSDLYMIKSKIWKARIAAHG
jgi:hypothetical protein